MIRLPKEDGEMQTSKDIASALHVSEQTVRAYARDGLIPFVTTPGGHRRFDLAAVKAALETSETYDFEPLEAGPSSSFLSLADQEVLVTPSHIAISRPFVEDADAVDDPDRPLTEIPFLGVRGTTRVLVEGATAVRR